MRISKLNHKFDKASGKAREERRVQEGALMHAELRKRVAVADAVAGLEQKLKDRNQAAELTAIIALAISRGEPVKLYGSRDHQGYLVHLRIGSKEASYAIHEHYLGLRDDRAVEFAIHSLVSLMIAIRQSQLNPWATP